ALQRNHHKARRISLGTTIPRDFASSSCTNGTPTRLKKYNRPIQVMPATKWTQRSAIRAVASPPGNWIAGERRSATSQEVISWSPLLDRYPAPCFGIRSSARILHHRALCRFQLKSRGRRLIVKVAYHCFCGHWASGAVAYSAAEGFLQARNDTWQIAQQINWQRKRS